MQVVETEQGPADLVPVAAVDRIANQRVTYAMSNTPVPVGFWRSVGSSQNAYVTECFFDELAKLAGRDPVERLDDARPQPSRDLPGEGDASIDEVLEPLGLTGGWGR